MKTPFLDEISSAALFPVALPLAWTGLGGLFALMTNARGFFWVLPNLIWLGFLGGASVCGTKFILSAVGHKAGPRIFTALFLTVVIVAWIVSLLLFSFLNGTALCIGQNNGDGVNTLELCEFYTGIAGAFYSLLMLPGVLIAAFRIPRAFRLRGE